MLSNEKPANTQAIDEYVGQLARMQSNRLASQLIQYEHNPDPREAPNPADGVRIRRITLIPEHTPVDEACRDHNSTTEDLGHPGWAELWRRSR